MGAHLGSQVHLGILVLQYMDIQLHVTDKELEEFPEERSDQIGINIIDRADTSLPISKAKPIHKAYKILTASQRKTVKGSRTTNRTVNRQIAT